MKTVLVPVEATEEMVRVLAQNLTGEIAATCCAKTGGKGRSDGKPCYCRDIAVELWPKAI